jgi:hypothetical protein
LRQFPFCPLMNFLHGQRPGRFFNHLKNSVALPRLALA